MTDVSKGKAAGNAFNRTIVELKFRFLRSAETALIAFNRTIVELKYRGVVGCDVAGYTFNRTIVELKWIMKKENTIFEYPLIEP